MASKWSPFPRREVCLTNGSPVAVAPWGRHPRIGQQKPARPRPQLPPHLLFVRLARAGQQSVAGAQLPHQGVWSAIFLIWSQKVFRSPVP